MQITMSSYTSTVVVSNISPLLLPLTSFSILALFAGGGAILSRNLEETEIGKEIQMYKNILQSK